MNSIVNVEMSTLMLFNLQNIQKTASNISSQRTIQKCSNLSPIEISCVASNKKGKYNCAHSSNFQLTVDHVDKSRDKNTKLYLMNYNLNVHIHRHRLSFCTISHLVLPRHCVLVFHTFVPYNELYRKWCT
jgi:hypothetical protein